MNYLPGKLAICKKPRHAISHVNNKPLIVKNFFELRNNVGMTDGLSREMLPASPFLLLENWLETAAEANFFQPNAMCLATATPQGEPSVRTVLMKSFDTDGLHFYTCYDSKKGQQLLKNPQAEALFYWDRLERQIRVFGTVSKLSREASEAYFHSRPRDSQVSASISPQSHVISGREFLVEAFNKFSQHYQNQPIPLPDNWGGFLLSPLRFEFWQGRLGRLHDRFVYSKTEAGWEIQQLAP